jgi:hypothetical protein
VLIDSDILWGPHYEIPQEISRAPGFFELCLRVAKSIGLSGRPVVLFGTGLGIAEYVEPCIERRYFSTIHYLALVCSPEALAEHLHRRSAGKVSAEYVADHVAFTEILKKRAADGTPRIDLLDTTSLSEAETADAVTAWLRTARDQVTAR